MSNLPIAPSAGDAVTWRSVFIGTIGVTVISAVTPYNDYVINNSFITGNFFPPALVLGLLVLVGLNALLHAFVPRRALTGAETGVITAMLLVTCCVPGQGLMRGLVPLPVAMFQLGSINDTIWKAFTSLGLPSWLFAVEDLSTGKTSPVVTEFYARTPDDGSIPWGAWVVPLAGWGVFVACLWAALVTLATLLRQQWSVNERLPFPLAQLGTLLVEPPAPGRAVNRLLSNKHFWIATGAVFVLQGLVAMHVYQPENFPDLKFTFDLNKVLSEEPWRYLGGEVKRSTLYFSLVGIMYFIQSRVGFSLWAIFMIEQFILVSIRTTGDDVPQPAWDDQHLGACVVFLLGTLWIGRRHWYTVVRQAIGLERPASGQPNYATRARVLVAAALGMVVWLIVVGVTPWFAVVIVVFILAIHVIIARIVAETGLPFMRVMANLTTATSNFSPSLLTGRDVFFAGFASYAGPIASRESLLVHAQHGLQIAAPNNDSPSHRRRVVAAMAWALTVAFVVSAAASLWCYYSYSLPLNRGASVMENNYGAIDQPRQYIADPFTNHAKGQYPPKAHNAALHVTTGGTITAVLQFGALRYAAWPLAPVAYLVSHTWYIKLAWWSILVGWTLKVLVLRFGGASLFQTLKPAFVGLIVGEALATGFWLLIAMVMAWTGQDYQSIQFLPQ